MSTESAVDRLLRLSADSVALAGTQRVSGYMRTNSLGQTHHVDAYFRSPRKMGPRELIAAYRGLEDDAKNADDRLTRNRARNQRRNIESELRRRHIPTPRKGLKYAKPGMNLIQAQAAGLVPLPRSTEDYEVEQNWDIPPSPLAETHRVPKVLDESEWVDTPMPQRVYSRPPRRPTPAPMDLRDLAMAENIARKTGEKDVLDAIDAVYARRATPEMIAMLERRIAVMQPPKARTRRPTLAERMSSKAGDAVREVFTEGMNSGLTFVPMSGLPATEQLQRRMAS